MRFIQIPPHLIMADFFERRQVYTWRKPRIEMEISVQSRLKKFLGFALLSGLAGSAVGATYTTFDIPGSDHTAPSSINDSGTVTGDFSIQGVGGYQGFLRTSAGVITTFAVPGAVYTQPASINANGDVTGVCSFGGFVRTSDGTIATFNVPGADPNGTSPLSINASGEITGYWTTNGAYLHGFLRTSDGTITTFDLGYGGYTQPVSINTSGEIAGTYVTTEETWEGFVMASDGSVTTFSSPGAGSDFISAINDAGMVTGQVATRITIGLDYFPVYQGFVWESQTGIQTFVAGEKTQPYSINASSQVTGRFIDRSNAEHGFLGDTTGKTTTFDVPGSQSTTPVSINAAGVITGYWNDQHGFIRTP
jgi:hypothetical protein